MRRRPRARRAGGTPRSRHEARPRSLRRGRHAEERRRSARGCRAPTVQSRPREGSRMAASDRSPVRTIRSPLRSPSIRRSAAASDHRSGLLELDIGRRSRDRDDDDCRLPVRGELLREYFVEPREAPRHGPASPVRDPARRRAVAALSSVRPTRRRDTADHVQRRRPGQRMQAEAEARAPTSKSGCPSLRARPAIGFCGFFDTAPPSHFSQACRSRRDRPVALAAAL